MNIAFFELSARSFALFDEFSLYFPLLPESIDPSPLLKSADQRIQPLQNLARPSDRPIARLGLLSEETGKARPIGVRVDQLAYFAGISSRLSLPTPSSDTPQPLFPAPCLARWRTAE